MIDVDYLRSMGGEALGGRLRRLSERIDREANEIYRSCGIEFEQRWFGIINQLILHDELSVTDIARRLGITHASVSQSRRSLERAGLIEGMMDEKDRRRRILRLTPKGKTTAASLAPFWKADKRAMRKLTDEIPSLMDAIDALENALESRSLEQRINEELESCREV